MTSMRAVYFEKHGGPQQLVYGDFPRPVPKKDECLVRVRAAALNGFEPMILGRTTTLRTPLPMIPGGDIAGEIVSFGSSANGPFQIGDRVFIDPDTPSGMVGETRQGGCAEYVSVPITSLRSLPDGISFVDGAALTIAYGTAHRMLVTRGKVRDETVFVHGATGGVGVACVQLLKLLGCRVIASGSKPSKLKRLREIGVDHVVDSTKEDFVQVLHDLVGKPRVSGGGGVDVVINYIGGDTWARSLRVLRRHGRMLTCGATAAYAPPTDIRYIWSFELSIIGSDGWENEDLLTVFGLVNDGKLKPILHAVRPLSETASSIQELIDRSVFGKIVLVPDAS